MKRTLPVTQQPFATMLKIYLLTVLSVLCCSANAQVTVTSVLGPQELAVVPFDYAMDGTEITLAEMDSGLFVSPYSIRAFYEEASYGKMTIRGIVYPYRTNQPPLFGTGYTSCYPEDAVIANQPDVDYSIIDGIVIFPHDTASGKSCSAGLSSSEKLPFSTPVGNHEFRRSGFRTQFYFPNDFSQTTSSTIAHELMHSFGNDFHSNAYIKIDGEWTLQGYGNLFDILGLRSQASHPCSMIKHKLGWLTENEIKTVQQTDTFRIYALEKTLPGKTQALIVELPHAVDLQPNDAFAFDRLYLEYRGLTGFDYRSPALRRVRLKDNSYHANDNIHGLLVIGVDCTSGDDCLPMLIDMRPEPIGGLGAGYLPHEASDAPLLLGEKYTVPGNEISMEVINVNEGNYIDVVITMPAVASSIEPYRLDGVEIYPSPAQDYIRISNPNAKSLTARLYDVYGNLVLNGENGTTMDISGLSAGVYILIVRDINTNRSMSRHIVKL
ncbi:MAG: T9SS type A sorting domain-containing protein [Bacteroidetes bacterium]|nr:T9SS type A sorting domain-containing protein [Bacteroidota bacterium]